MPAELELAGSRRAPADRMLSDRLRGGHALQKSPRRAYALLRAAIRTGELPSSSRLEESSLVKALMTSRNAVRLALQQLGEDGLVERRPGAGTVVVEEIRQFPVFECLGPTLGVTAELCLVEAREVPLSAHLSSRFDRDQGTIWMSEYLVKVRGRAIGIFSRYGLAPAPALETARPVLGPDELSWYRRIHGEAPGDIHVAIEATGADERTAKLLGIERDRPLLMRETLYFDRTRTPRELHVTHLDSRRAALVTTASHPTETA